MKKPKVITLMGNRGGWHIPLPSMEFGGFCAILASQSMANEINMLHSGYFPRAGVLEIREDDTENDTEDDADNEHHQPQV